MGKKLFAAAVAAAALGLSIAAGPAAVAVEGDGYPPVTPTEPSLSGSVAASECVGDVPWISYRVTLNDPEGLITSQDAFLRITGSGESIDLPLGTIGADGTLAGRTLWPGASVDAAGNATGWPGWMQNSAGEWVATSGNYAWTRGNINATIHVNPELTVPLSYPAASPLCANPKQASGDNTALAYTGSTVSWVAVGVGAGALAAGGALLIARRRRSHS